MARSDPRYGPLIIEQGVTTRRFFTFTNKYTGAVIDPVAEGYTAAVLQVRTAHLGDGGELLINLTTSNGGIVLGLQTDDNGVQRSGRSLEVLELHGARQLHVQAVVGDDGEQRLHGCACQ